MVPFLRHRALSIQNRDTKRGGTKQQLFTSRLSPHKQTVTAWAVRRGTWRQWEEDIKGFASESEPPVDTQVLDLPSPLWGTPLCGAQCLVPEDGGGGLGQANKHHNKTHPVAEQYESQQVIELWQEPVSEVGVGCCVDLFK